MSKYLQSKVALLALMGGIGMSTLCILNPSPHRVKKN